MSLKSWSALLLLAALLALAGCGRAPSDPGAALPSDAPAPSQADGLDATWQGVLPCSDCDGIQTRLRLLADNQGRRFELQETYLAQDGGDAFQSQGNWVEEAGEIDGQPVVVYRLDAGGASRWFSLQPDGALEMLEDRQRPMVDALAHRLQRL
ncbi:MAG: hypothetical protein DCF27_08700 [Lysobacteraceae bacterium]|nr:MAG: hypothetical protein DCF27_08700 [Xanthomonadaceae bacterium]